MSLRLFIFTKLFGKFIARDEFGNCYYEAKYNFKFLFRSFGRKKRWVIYSKRSFLSVPEATEISNRWFNWLHYREDKKENTECFWHISNSPNMTFIGDYNISDSFCDYPKDGEYTRFLGQGRKV